MARYLETRSKPNIFKSRIMPVLRLIGRALAAGLACPPVAGRRPSENETRFQNQDAQRVLDAYAPDTPTPDYFGSRRKSNG